MVLWAWFKVRELTRSHQECQVHFWYRRPCRSARVASGTLLGLAILLHDWHLFVGVEGNISGSWRVLRDTALFELWSHWILLNDEFELCFQTLGGPRFSTWLTRHCVNWSAGMPSWCRGCLGLCRLLLCCFGFTSLAGRHIASFNVNISQKSSSNMTLTSKANAL